MEDHFRDATKMVKPELVFRSPLNCIPKKFLFCLDSKALYSSVCPKKVDILSENCNIPSMITAMDIRDQVRLDVLDYQQLTACLKDYAKPRDRISALLAEGSLIRVRKGLYVFGERYRRAPVNRGVLANLIYGPSYVSLDYALSYHGLTPERVENLTSVTTGGNRRFSTPFGVFTYQPLPVHRYAPGVQWSGDGDNHFLMASPEKALVDKVWTDKRFRPAGLKDYPGYLLEDLRIDEPSLATLNRDRLGEVCRAFTSRKIDMLVRSLERFKDIQK